MPLITTKEMLLAAQNGGYAVGAFNVENMEMVRAVISAAEEMNSPVILQTTPGTLRYESPAMFAAMASAAADKSSAKIAMHLDHGDSFQRAQQVLQAGYTSVMIDGSRLPLEENIALSSRVTELCHAAGIPVEAELGKVGGKEDDISVEGETPFTDPAEAVEFVKRTAVDSLAVGIGTSHGIYQGEPHVDLDVLSQIRSVVDIPLVMHGTSGVPDETVAKAVRLGICKVNYATELRIAFSDAVKQYLAEHPDEYDPKKYGSAGRDAVKELVKHRIQNLGSAGKNN